MPEFHLMSLIYRNSTASVSKLQANIDMSTFTTLEVRVGYLGLCARKPGAPWLCSSSDVELLEWAGGDPLILDWLASRLQFGRPLAGTMFAAILSASMSVMLFLNFPGWHAEQTDDGKSVDVKPFPSSLLRRSVTTVLGLTAVVFLAVQLWQTAQILSASSVVENLGHGSIQTKVGFAAMASNWCTCVLFLGALIAWYPTYAEMEMLDGLTEEKPKED